METIRYDDCLAVFDAFTGQHLGVTATVTVSDDFRFRLTDPAVREARHVHGVQSFPPRPYSLSLILVCFGEVEADGTMTGAVGCNAAMQEPGDRIGRVRLDEAASHVR